MKNVIANPLVLLAFNDIVGWFPIDWDRIKISDIISSEYRNSQNYPPYFVVNIAKIGDEVVGINAIEYQGGMIDGE